MKKFSTLYAYTRDGVVYSPSEVAKVFLSQPQRGFSDASLKKLKKIASLKKGSPKGEADRIWNL